MKQFTVLGNGSWSSALVKMLNDNQIAVNWWMRNEESIMHLQNHARNPHYLSSVEYDMQYIHPTHDMKQAIEDGDIILVGIPSAYIKHILSELSPTIFRHKKVLSAIKGLLPVDNVLLGQYLKEHFGLQPEDYFCITGPCHAEEIAAEKLSYLTFGGTDDEETKRIADLFETYYVQTICSRDVKGIQYAAVLKNIYALGAGIAHGLDYGDNFLSVYITNCFAELQRFMEAIATEQQHHYNTSAYLGDLLVTCYSLHSRNRRFGNYIGKGYSVDATRIEMNMEAEGYFACRGIHELNRHEGLEMPIAEAVYKILWENASAQTTFETLEPHLL